jgi:protein-tyrosine-phosphatase
MGVDIAAHRSLPLTPAMIAGADIIFGMTNSHVHAVLSMDPASEAKVFALDPEGGDILDPFGQSQEIYDQTAAAIHGAIEQRAGLIAGR